MLDFDGDGRADIGVFRNGIWYINTARSTAPRRSRSPTARAGDLPLARLLQPRQHAIRESGEPLHRTARRPIRTGRSPPRGRTRSTATSCASRRAPIPRISSSAIPAPVRARQVRQEQHQADRRFASTRRSSRPLREMRSTCAAHRATSLRGLTIALAGRGRARARAGRRPQFGLPDLSRAADQRFGVRPHGEPRAERAAHRRVERMVPLRAPEPQPRRARHFGLGQYVRARRRERDQQQRLHRCRWGRRYPMPARASTSASESEGDARRSTVHANLTFGIVGASAPWCD